VGSKEKAINQNDSCNLYFGEGGAEIKCGEISELKKT
jgi:hypothetical protein